MVKETEYYELLGVAVDADEVQIKKGYRKAALRWHPDKNPGDPEAEKRFKDIAEAYQVLSDPGTRGLYDEVGKAGMQAQGEGAGDVDPKEFFTMIFGGEGFKDYIGELGFLKMMFEDEEAAETAEGAKKGEDNEKNGNVEKEESGTKESKAGAQSDSTHLTTDNATDNTFSKMQQESKEKAKEQRKKLNAEMIRKQREEEAKKVKELADKLKVKMDPVVAHTKGSVLDTEGESWKKLAKTVGQDIEDLKGESFGVEICHLIGKVYGFKGVSFLKSKKAFTGGFHKFSSNFKQGKDTVKGMMDMVSQASEAQNTMEAMSQMEEGDLEGMDPYKRAEFEQTMTGKFISVAWASSKFEIQQTLYGVCNEVLNEKGVSLEVRKVRAQVLIEMGKMFAAAAREDDDADDGMVFEKMMHDANATKARDLKREARTPKATPKGTPLETSKASSVKSANENSSTADAHVNAEPEPHSSRKSRFGLGGLRRKFAI